MSVQEAKIMVTNALLTDEVSRTLGNGWVENLRGTSRRPDVTADSESEARSQIRSFLADEIRNFNDRPYSNHPDYQMIVEQDGVNGETISSAELAERVARASITCVQNNHVGIWMRNENRASVYIVDGWKARCAREQTMTKAEAIDTLDDFTNNPTKLSEGATPWNDFTYSGQPLTADPRTEDVSDSEAALIRDVINDEIQRIAGNSTLARIRNFEVGNALSYTDIYLNEGTGEDEYYPPTEENIRAFARNSLAINISDYDGLFQKSHDDYIGFYDPHGFEKSDEERYADIISEAKEVARDGNYVALWNGVVGIDGARERRQGEVSEGSAHVYVYGPDEPGDVPKQLRHFGADVEDTEELREKLQNMATDARKRYSQ